MCGWHRRPQNSSVCAPDRNSANTPHTCARAPPCSAFQEALLSIPASQARQAEACVSRSIRSRQVLPGASGWQAGSRKTAARRVLGRPWQARRCSGTRQRSTSMQRGAGARVDEQPAAVVRVVGHQRVVCHAAREARQDGQHVDVERERGVRPGAQRACRQRGCDAQCRQQVRQDVAWRARAAGRRAARSGMPGESTRGTLVGRPTKRVPHWPALPNARRCGVRRAADRSGSRQSRVPTGCAGVTSSATLTRVAKAPGMGERTA